MAASCTIMHENNIGSVVIVNMNGANSQEPICIITDKDIFRAKMNNQYLITSLPSNKLLEEHKSVYDQFGQNWFGVISVKELRLAKMVS
ncbi:MAG TPA: hypothetical protein VFI73_12330 [Candidatus Nitrosopolaris sp.]|nr:hypothetical protein [Candidatus Nitrosopolaris sp.]